MVIRPDAQREPALELHAAGHQADDEAFIVETHERFVLEDVICNVLQPHEHVLRGDVPGRFCLVPLGPGVDDDRVVMVLTPIGVVRVRTHPKNLLVPDRNETSSILIR